MFVDYDILTSFTMNKGEGCQIVRFDFRRPWLHGFYLPWFLFAVPVLVVSPRCCLLLSDEINSAKRPVGGGAEDNTALEALF